MNYMQCGKRWMKMGQSHFSFHQRLSPWYRLQSINRWNRGRWQRTTNVQVTRSISSNSSSYDNDGNALILPLPVLLLLLLGLIGEVSGMEMGGWSVEGHLPGIRFLARDLHHCYALLRLNSIWRWKLIWFAGCCRGTEEEEIRGGHVLRK